MGLNEFGSIASIISLFIGIFIGAVGSSIYHVKIKAKIIKKNTANTLINSGNIDQNNR